MTGFADQLMIRYIDPVNVDSLLVPPDDTTRQRARALLASVYEPRLLTVQSVDSVTVTARNFQVPVVEPTTVNGTWEKIIPQSERSLISFDLPIIAQTDWIDMALEATVSVRVSATSAPLDAVTAEDVSELSQQDFLAKFQFLDLAALMKSANVATYQELQTDFPASITSTTLPRRPSAPTIPEPNARTSCESRCRANTPASAPAEFTNPADAIAMYPAARSVTDAVLNGTTTVTSATANFAAPDVGRPVTGTGIPNGTTIAMVTNGTTILLSAAATATATGITLTFGAKPNESTDLAAAIAIAFRQTPPPTRVWGVQVDATTPAWDAALAEVANLNVQIVALANMPLNQANAAVIGKLAPHVATVSNTGGDGKERIGVAMLDASLTAAAAAALNTGNVRNERMFLIAHTSAELAGAAAAGVIAGYEAQISMLLEPIKINMIRLFSDADIDTLNGAFINCVTSPVLIPGQSLFLGEGYTADPSPRRASRTQRMETK